MRVYRHGMIGRLVDALALAAVCNVAACNTSCDEEDRVATLVTDGTTNSARTVYESASWDGRYLEFRPGKSLVFEHGLQMTPFAVLTYVAFSPCPLAPAGSCPDDDAPSGEVAESAGNIAPISDVDSETFTVRNKTCEKFYLRVTAQAYASAPGALVSTEGTAGIPE
jgi:hypothetical protein